MQYLNLAMRLQQSDAEGSSAQLIDVMAKRDESRSSKSKMTVLVFQLEGSDQTIQEGLKKIGQTVDGMMKPPPRLALKSNPSSAASGADTDDEGDSEGTDTSDEPDELDSGTETPSRRRPGKERAPELVPLDESQAKVKLADYCAQKAVGDSVMRRYLVLALWWKEAMGVPEVSMDHIYTCYKTMGWHDFPDSGSAAFRMIKSKKEAFEKGSGKGLYKINHIGERLVNTPPQA